MLARRSFAKLCVALFFVSLSSTAFAQVKPRFVVGIDTSGSMLWDMSGNTTFGDGVGRPAINGDNAALVKDGVFYGCGTTAGLDRNCNGFPDDSKMAIAKKALRDMIVGFGDVEWALAKFKQTHALNATCSVYDGSNNSHSCNAQSFGNPQCNTGNTDNNGCIGGIGVSCRPGQGTNSSLRVKANNDFNGCINYAGGCLGADLLVGFPGSGAFSAIDNRPAILKWMDNVETAFDSSTTAGNFCNHATTGDCELRPNGSTPIGSLIQTSGGYATTTRSGDTSSSCRQYSILLLTDGAETCSSNPNQEAFKLAFPTQAAAGTCNPAAIPNVTPDIKVYVVGISVVASEQTSLNQIAACGGTTQAYFPTSPAELASALSNIVAGSIKFETCNGLDDDCDNAIDEDIPLGQPGTAPQPQALFCDGEARRSAAQNTQVRARSDISDTLPQTTPVTQQIVCGQVNDTCSHPGFDDDCDGKFDENDANLTACGTCPGAPDICDGIDNDCDGKYDEGVNSGVQFSACPTQCTMDVPCGSNVGTCVPGVYKCVSGTLNTSTCVGSTGPTTEICDEKDNNCNGIVDDPATLQHTCTTPYGNVGICQPGIQYCAKPSIGEMKDAQGYHVDSMGRPVCEGQVLPENQELCDALDHDCDGNNFTCTTHAPDKICVSQNPLFVGNSCGSGIGICKGTLMCNTSANPPALVCNAPSPTTETCNNIDDNCNGAIDDNAVAGPDLGSVNGGPANSFCGTESRTAGVCNPGHFECINGHWQCRDEAGPATEICNGNDDDCDGMTDESADVMANDPRIGQQCGTSVGECKPGFSVCTAGNIACTPVQGPVTETCDGKDNDCDYLTDENLPDNNNDGVMDVQSCGSSVGLCKPGQIACAPVPLNVDPDGFDYKCVGGVGPVPEICDGQDNDCDGTTDECAGDHNSAAYIACATDALGNLGAGGGDTCGSNVAPCMPGKTKCIADADGMGHAGFTCVGSQDGSPETCNGKDDDCDTKIDEDLDPLNDPNLGKRCNEVIVGACRIDVDHDGVANDPDDAPCGQCRFGIQECVLGAIDCVGAIGPSMYERCNNSDDDCDDKIDECVDPNDSSCAPGEVDPNTPVGTMCGNTTGECKQGTNTCQNGVLTCKDRVGTTDEVCNNKDDDCDHNVDEGLGKGTPCGSSIGECRTGTMVCAPDNSGGLVCNGGQGPSDEVCDGLDNDCDGKTDEGLGLGEPCGTDEGTCSKGKLECQNGHTVCSGEKGPQLETCDCEDNDCDGKIDETSSTEPICPGSAECIMCQCALPCAPTTEFSAQCPQGKAAVDDHGDCYCVGEQCRQLDCQKQTIKVADEVQCAPDNDLVGTCLCKNNDCTFRCAGVTCDSSLICDPTDGRCKQRSCLLPQFRCTDGKRCQLSDANSMWNCVDDPCADKKCASAEMCRDGVCLKSCADVTCSTGNICKDGTCVVDHCHAVQCDPGQVCNPKDGKCVTAGACVSTGCADGQVCDRVSGQCNEDPCLGTHCPYAQQCNSDTSQCEPRCFGGLLFCDDACVNPMTSHDHCGASDDCRGENAGDACKAGLVCSRGKCAETCADNLLNCGGECIDPTTDRDHCGAKSDCKGKNDGVVCKSGTECVEGACKAFDVNGGGGTSADMEDHTRVIAAGGGGCACSVPGTTQGTSSQRGLFSLLLFAFGGAVLMRRRRPRAARLASQVLLLALASIGLGLFGSGCKVDTFCLDCPPKGMPDKMSDAGDGKSDGGGSGGTTGGSGGSISTGDGGGSGGMNGGGGGGGGSGGSGSGGTGAKGDGGQCGLTEVCNGIDDDCDGKIDEDTDPAAFNIDVKNDPNNCGKCGAVCALQHAFNACKKSECAIDTTQGDHGCDVGYHNLDKDDSNGCEYHCTKTANDDSLCDLVDNDCDNKIDENVDFKNDADNCGGCGFRCAPNHAAKGGVCEDGKCTLDDTKCDDGFINLDDKPANGCEYPCPVFPTVGELCNFLDDDCDGKVDEDTQVADSTRIGIACGTDEGECVAGTYICKDGAPFCNGSVGPSPEVCDGLDNDCDGDVDIDDPEIGIPCGADVTPGSQCSKGIKQIPAGGCSGGTVMDLACVGEQGPVPELCNGLDDDCDGKADEAENGMKPQEGQKCTNGVNGLEIVTTDPPGLCKAGGTVCESGHLVCRNEIAPETTELCDNKDHDCDGKTVADFTPDVPNGTTATSGPDPRVGKNCGIDTGECSFGVQTCHLDTMTLSCDGKVDPVPEICDGKDNDCDGLIDEHTDNSGHSVVLQGEGVACVTNSNGTVNTSPPASASRGHCQTGTTVCSAGKIGCSGQVGPVPELCDDEDQDCDGNPSNGVSVTDPMVGKPCGPPTVGVCKTGTTTCNGSNQVVCTGAMPSATYVPPAQTNTKETACDGLDNDCDGATDEGTPASYDGATCCDITGFSCCDTGTRQCANARIQCVYPVGAKFPKAEVCGGGDDDCDTKVDEGFDTHTDVNNCGSCGNVCKFNNGITPHAVLVCAPPTMGAQGACKIGACDTGFIDKNNDYHDGCELPCTFTGNEVCDSTDNDCDGTVDNLQSVPSAVCISKKTGVCDVPELLTQGPKCTSGALTCDIQSLVTAGKISNYQAVEDLCDGLDNDCDGKIDEGHNPPVGQVCHKGQGACQTTGTNVCMGTGATVCNAATPGMGSTETCNGLDDDCNGTVDDFATPTLANPVGNIDFVDLGATTGHTLAMAFEASHPDAATTNRSTTKVCSVDGATPWNNVTWDEAKNACCSLNSGGTCAGNGTGWRLCDSSTWDYVCRGPGSGCNWGYSNLNGAVCNHDPRVSTYSETCAGAEALHDGKWSCPQGTNECATVTGSGTFPECRAVWPDGDVFDLSGNMQEWTNTAQGSGIYEIRGGSYNDVENGRTCDFNFVVGNTSFRFPNTGFRCCYYPSSAPNVCTTYDSGVTAANPVNATGNNTTSTTITVANSTGKVTAVRLLDVTGNNVRFNDLQFQLSGPSSTGPVTVVARPQCGNSVSNWAFDLRDDAATAIPNGAFCTATPAGGSTNNAYKPSNALSAFNTLTSANGTWTLSINDSGNQSGSVVGSDWVQITGWKLEICVPQYVVP